LAGKWIAIARDGQITWLNRQPKGRPTLLVSNSYINWQTDALAHQPTNRPTNQPTNQPTDRQQLSGDMLLLLE